MDRELRLLQFVNEQVQHAIHQRDVDALTLAGARALDQRGLNRGITENPTQHVGDEHGSCRGPIPVPGIPRQRAIKAALGMHNHGVGRALGSRTGLPVA